jgi:hypothetical protein
MANEFLIISQNSYGALCFIAGLGWGLFITTLAAAILTYKIRWGMYVRTGR